jgi:hypothetical protein
MILLIGFYADADPGAVSSSSNVFAATRSSRISTALWSSLKTNSFVTHIGWCQAVPISRNNLS